VSEWRWLVRDVILAVHDEQLAEHGGRPGIRDIGLLDSALARPLNYGQPTVFDLAAGYAFGIVRNHPFVDGNKRVGFLAAALFLAEHELQITATDEAIVASVLGLAGGGMDEAAFAVWLRENTALFSEPLATRGELGEGV
jgi:death-on-curing protein